MCRKIIGNRNEILPFKTGLSCLGYFFLLAIGAYALYVKYPYKIILIIEIISLLFIFLSMFFVIGISNYKKKIKREKRDHTLSCLDCIKNIIEDGFHFHGLLHLNDLLEIEKKLSSNNSPKDCKVLVYTSDLATENDAEAEVTENIKKGVQYIVLYFSDNCTSEQRRKIKRLYGKGNLIHLKEEKYRDSFDGRLANTLGFDITIYKVNDKIHGYFAVDFAPQNSPAEVRPSHILKCAEQCNYGKQTQAFYKKLSYQWAKRLFDEGLSIQRDVNNRNKTMMKKNGQR